jgi:hypothetical protein
MEASIPAVLGKLAQSGVSVQWRDGKAVFKAAAAPSADIVALIDARKAEISVFLHPEAVQRRLDADADVLRAEPPPDVDAARWEIAQTGLRAFIAAGHGAEAERLGWPKDELYAAPPLWARVDLCGAGLLIGDREVVAVTADRIQIKSASGAILSFYRKPEVDYRLVYETRRKALVLNLGADEAHFRAVDFAINFCRQHSGVDLEEAKKQVWGAIAKEGL